MSVYTYDYGELKTAANKADKAATRCERYVSRIGKSITRKLSDLEHGETSNTQNANYLAQNKIKKLGTKANNFRMLSRQIMAVRNKAKEKDKEVADYIKSDAREFRRNHGMNVNVVVEFFTWLSISMDNSIGFIRNLKEGMRGIANWIDAKKRGFKEWFFLDGGKYIFKMALAAIALVIGTVTLFAVAIPAFLSAASIILAGTVTAASLWTAITATAGVITAVLTVVDSATKIFTNAKALATNETDPGWASRTGEIGSFSEYLKKTVFNSKLGNQISMISSHMLEIASDFASIVNIANIAHSAHGFFKSVKEKGIEKVFSKVRFKTKDGKVTFATFKHGMKRVKENIDIIRNAFDTSSYSRLKNSFEPSGRLWKGAKALQKILKSSNTVAGKGFGKFIGDIVKDKMKKYVLPYKYGSSIKDMIDSINKTRKGWNYANRSPVLTGE